MQAAAIERLRRLRLPYALSRASLILPGSIWFAWWVGARIGTGTSHTMFMGLALAAVAVPIGSLLWARRIGYGALALEVPMLLLVLSSLVLRQRSTDELAYNPLDQAAQFRVACVALALTLGIFAHLSSGVHADAVGQRVTTRPFRLYVLYALIVFAGAPLSVN